MGDERVLTNDPSNPVAAIGATDVALVGAGIRSSAGSLSLAPFTDSTAGVVIKNASSVVIGTFDTTNKRLRVGDATVPGAVIDIASGGGAAGVPPLRLPSAVLTAPAIPGAIEYDGTNFWITAAGPSRVQIATGSALIGYTNAGPLFNTALGSGAAPGALTGNNDLCVGYNAGNALTSGIGVTLLGFYAGSALTNQSYNTFVGMDAGRLSTTSQSTYIGTSAGYYPDGQANTGVGYNALYGAAGLKTATRNTAVGWSAGSGLTSGSDNCYIGYSCGSGEQVGSQNVGVGVNVMTSGGSDNTKMVAVGFYAGYMAGSDSNVFIGYQSGGYLNGGAGSNNATAGSRTLTSISSGNYNSAFGSECLVSVSTGTGNIGLGYGVGSSLSTGTYCILIGYNANVAAAANTNSIVIGYGETGKGSNTTVIGRSSATATTDTWLRASSAGAVHLGNETSGAVYERYETTDRGSAGSRPGFRFSGGSTGMMQVSHDGTNWGDIGASPAMGFTPEGGLYVWVLNKTGANSVQGTLVRASTTTDLAVDILGTSDQDGVGVVYDAGVADGSMIRIVVSGWADVLIEAADTIQRDYWLGSPDTTAGRGHLRVSPSSTSEHFRECGHCFETKANGGNTLARCMIHFN